MQQEHRDAIRSNFTSLVERTDLDSVVTALYERGVFSEQMIEPYKNCSDSERDRKRKLYMNIMLRGPDAFGHLVDVLGEQGHWDLVRDLDPDSPYSYSTRNSSTILPKPKPPQPDDNFRSLSQGKSKPASEAPKSVPSTSPPPPQPSAMECDDVADDVDPPFVVKKSVKFMEDDDTKDLKLYRTRGRNRGILLDFTYMEFDNNIEDFRNGVDVDCKNLKYLFSELGFRVLRYLNLTKQETIDTLKSLNAVLSGAAPAMESVFVVVSSHGYERAHTSDNDVRCKDGQLISLYEILKHFDNQNMPGLIGVPKIFIFQMCRGGNKDYATHSAVEAEMAHAPPQLSMPLGSVLHAEHVAHDGQPLAPAALAPAPRVYVLPLYSDVLIAHSTLPGLVARRDGKSGSWYIQVLCEMFAARAHDCHVEKLFTLVDQRMQEKFKVQTSSVDRWGFNKRLYLHPGLYES